MNPTSVLRVASFLIVAMALSACAAPLAPDISGRWKPVNRYAETTQEIPLRQAYVFHPSPMDRTLKTMLERWAKDSHMQLEYQHSSDFTLHAPVVEIRTTSLRDAIASLSEIYAPQRVAITTADNRIVVRRSEPLPMAAATQGASASGANAPTGSPSPR